MWRTVLSLLLLAACGNQAARGEFSLLFNAVDLGLPGLPAQGDLQPLSAGIAVALVQDTSELVQLEDRESTLLLTDVRSFAVQGGVVLAVTEQGELLRRASGSTDFEPVSLQDGLRVTSVRYAQDLWWVGAVQGEQGLVLESDDGQDFRPRHQGLAPGFAVHEVSYTTRYSSVLQALGDEGQVQLWLDDRSLEPLDPTDLGSVPPPVARSRTGWLLSEWLFDDQRPEFDVAPIALSRAWQPGMELGDVSWFHIAGIGLSTYTGERLSQTRLLGLDEQDRLVIAIPDAAGEPQVFRAPSRFSAFGDRFPSLNTGPGCTGRYRRVERRVGAEPEVRVSVQSSADDTVHTYTLLDGSFQSVPVPPGEAVEIEAPGDAAILVLDQRDFCLAFERQAGGVSEGLRVP